MTTEWLDDVTLIVPAKDRLEQTRQLLDSLRSSHATSRIILVDDHSTQPYNDAAAAYRDLDLTLIRNDRPLGPAISRNIGIQRSHTPFIAFTDNDVCVHPLWLKTMVSRLKDAPTHVAGGGGRTLHAGTSLVGSYATRLGLLNPFVRKGGFSTWSPQTVSFAEQPSIRWRASRPTFRYQGEKILNCVSAC